MHVLYTCVAERHDLLLVGVAALICCLGAWAAFALGREVRRAPDPRSRWLWGIAATVAAAAAIWATHFIAMLAFDPGLPFRLEAGLTTLSALLGVGLIGLGGAVIAARPGTAGRATGGALIGLAISGIHYTGMGAYRVQGSLDWNLSMVAVSVLAGASLTAFAVLLAAAPHPVVRRGAPAFFVLAICLDHFIGMAAVTIIFDPAGDVPRGMLDERLLAILVVVASLLIIGFSLAAVLLAHRDRRQRSAEERRLRDVADMSMDGLLICRGDTILRVNRSLELMLDREGRELVGQPASAIGLDLATIPIGREVEATLPSLSGKPIPVRATAQETVIGQQRHLVIALRDQRDQLRTESRLRRLAHSDSLTGLSNRLDFNERLTERLERHEGIALLLMDLDRFKEVNDSFGHAMGDELLRRVAGRLRHAVRQDDLVARLGGDEFAILAPAGDNPAAVRRIASDVVDLLCRPFLIDGQIVEIGVSVGIALAPTDSRMPEELSRCADLALYRAKEEGGRAFRVFDQEMRVRMKARRALELDLRRAVATGEFEVHYQPQVDPRTGQLDGAEALVRWRHRERGLVSPAEFIPLAEEIGLIGSISEFVLGAACTEAASWPSHLSVAVNLSPVEFRNPNLAEAVATILARTGLPGARLELEITESALLQDEGNTLATLNALRAQGIRLSMDDFGTGYSSLSYLRRFPFDKIKIDQSFIRQVPTDRDSIAIVQAIAGLGAKLGMTVTVEGVETAEQRAFAVSEGCDQIQGYLVSKPLPLAAMRDVVAAQAVRHLAA